MISLDRPLDLTDPEADAFLQGIQGNILKSHGRDYAHHVFVQFGSNAQAARAWIADFASHVTSAARQLAQTAAWKNHGAEGELFMSLALSFPGYTAAGLPAEQIPVESNFTYFSRGMKDQANAERPFNDPPKEQWEGAFQREVHAMVILAHDSPERLERATEEVVSSVSQVADHVWIERGQRLEFTFPSGVATIEHFGFEDGISNPILIQQDADVERAERGADKWDPAAPLSLVLTAEPGRPDRFGNYLVFRKLEQNVAAFDAALAELARLIDPAGDVERAGAMAVGRFRDGTSIVPVTAPVAGAKQNNFTFVDADPSGGICPFHAHIRKTNPRGDSLIGLPGELRFRIVRRGITYGDRPDLAAGAGLPRPERGVGLLFMSYQAALDAFAIQQEGADVNDFARPGVGVDAVIGRNAAPVAQEWPTGSGRRFTMAGFVTMLGGEYLFAPSLPFLRSLRSVDAP